MKYAQQFINKIINLHKEGLGYEKIRIKLKLNSTTPIRRILNPKGAYEQNIRCLNRYYKYKALGICPQCGQKRNG